MRRVAKIEFFPPKPKLRPENFRPGGHATVVYENGEIQHFGFPDLETRKKAMRLARYHNGGLKAEIIEYKR